jgi:hypothetical protein
VHRQRLTLWIIGTVLAFAALGAWGGHLLGGGGSGYIALMSATCAVLGSFVPGAVRWASLRVRGQQPPHRGAA